MSINRDQPTGADLTDQMKTTEPSASAEPSESTVVIGTSETAGAIAAAAAALRKKILRQAGDASAAGTAAIPFTVLEGIVSAEAAIRGGSRKIYGCCVDAEKVKRRDRRIGAFLKLLREKEIPTVLCGRAEIDALIADTEGMAYAGTTHGGVAALCGERILSSPEELIEKTVREGGFSVFLDGIEDPYNFGYSLRNLYAAGVSGVLIPHRNWLSAAGVCARASAGASELCSLAQLPPLPAEEARAALIRELHRMGMHLVCAAKTAESLPLFSFPATDYFPMLLLIGGEKRGISPELMKAADAVVNIPYFSEARYSLPTASTAAIFGFALAQAKQRQ